MQCYATNHFTILWVTFKKIIFYFFNSSMTKNKAFIPILIFQANALVVREIYFPQVSC